MKINYLLPSNWKPIGYVLFIIGFILSVMFMVMHNPPSIIDIQVFYIFNDGIFGDQDRFFGTMENNILDELAMILTIIGGMIISFSKLKDEDEFINKIRMESLIWAVYINYFILIFCILLFFDLTFFWVLVYNVFTPLVIFIIRFHWIILRAKKLEQDEE